MHSTLILWVLLFLEMDSNECCEKSEHGWSSNSTPYSCSTVICRCILWLEVCLSPYISSLTWFSQHSVTRSTSQVYFSLNDEKKDNFLWFPISHALEYIICNPLFKFCTLTSFVGLYHRPTKFKYSTVLVLPCLLNKVYPQKYCIFFVKHYIKSILTV